MAIDINKVCLDHWREAFRNLPPAVSGDYGRRTLWWACKLVHEMGVPLELATDLLKEEYNPICEPPFPEWELERTLRKAYEAEPLKRSPQWPEVDHELRDRIVDEADVTLEEFATWCKSPRPQPDPYFFLESLYPNGNPLVCVGVDQYTFATKPKSDWKDYLAAGQLVVPNPMIAPTGRPEGQDYQSPRTKENTGPEFYQVIEFDIAETKNGKPTSDAPLIRRMAEKGRSVDDINASLIAHLATKAPLVLTVHSGGKSLHGWFRVKDTPESTVEGFFNYACRLGADKCLWSPCHAVRLPDGIRSNGKIQRVKYFNPNKI